MSYLMNAWYAAGFGTEVSRTPLGRTLLDIPVVLYRTEGGAPVALYNRCSHRFVALSAGRLVGDAIECGYHGLRFDRAGECVFNPHGKVAPKAGRIPSYPTLERHGVVWFWPGDPERADPALIPPEFDFLSSPDFVTVSGYLKVKANYMLVSDNLLDLSHVAYLHPQFGVAGTKPEDRIRSTEFKFEREGDNVISRRHRIGVPPNDRSRVRYNIEAEIVDTRSDMYWLPPSTLYFDLGTTERSGKCRDFSTPAAHLLTPETALTTHYWFLQSRNVELDDEAVSRDLLEVTQTAFETQDAPMIEMQQAALGESTNIMAAKPLLLNIDGGPVLARRILEDKIAQEAAGRTAATSQQSSAGYVEEARP